VSGPIAASSPTSSRLELLDRLNSLRPELQIVTFDRISGIGGPAQVGEGDYLISLRGAVAAALDYGYVILERGPADRPPSVPAQLLVQARLAARVGVSVGSVLRRYSAGHNQFVALLIEQAEAIDYPLMELKEVLLALAAGVDRISEAVSAEHARESAKRRLSPAWRRFDLVRGLLAGELLSSAELRYDFDVWHLGLIATSVADTGAISKLSTKLDRSILQADSETDAVWAWLGGRRPFEEEELVNLEAQLAAAASTPIAMGEPAMGFQGWRVSHRQAAAMLPMAREGGQLILRYGRNPLLASALGDELLTRSLHDLYLAPLTRKRDGGAAARETLRAYFAAGGNVTSTAAALGVSRKTVNSRLAAVEEQLGRSLASVSAELQTALRLKEMEDSGAPIRHHE
jgi:hypothetical protein